MFDHSQENDFRFLSTYFFVKISEREGSDEK